MVKSEFKPNPVTDPKPEPRNPALMESGDAAANFRRKLHEALQCVSNHEWSADDILITHSWSEEHGGWLVYAQAFIVPPVIGKTDTR